MKIISKFTVLILLSLIMASCGPKKPPPVDPIDNNENQTQVEDRNTDNNDSVVTYMFNGKKLYDICCEAEDLNNPKSLLSERVILFAYDQATVESEYRELIAIHAKYLSANPSARVVLEGHADERGTPEYNLALGERRGKSVANLLRAQGASAAQVSVVSFGEEKPVALCNNESCWSQNRRVRIVYTAK
ncbi:MAG TPA: peptidoglycan-associated lipoprotein Pal [Oceanospirillales bacterium]|nr:peptidoglycan-associated lipoprotein Pal [Oceanospirillales bacterium]